MRAALILALVVAVAGTASCSRRPTPERALPYKAALKVAGDGELQVSVKAPEADLAAVRESVRYPVTRHCLLERGDSMADWEVDPTSGDWAYTVDPQGVMTFRTRCRV